MGSVALKSVWKQLWDRKIHLGIYYIQMKSSCNICGCAINVSLFMECLAVSDSCWCCYYADAGEEDKQFLYFWCRLRHFLYQTFTMIQWYQSSFFFALVSYFFFFFFKSMQSLYKTWVYHPFFPNNTIWTKLGALPIVGVLMFFVCCCL